MMHACAVLTVRDLCSGTYRLPISMTNISVEMARFRVRQVCFVYACAFS